MTLRLCDYKEKHMFASVKNHNWWVTLSLAILVSILPLTGNASNSEPLYPTALMNWLVEGSFHALIVDKSQQKLMVWQIIDGEPQIVETYKCSTGEMDGDKWVRGDMRTPEGVYFFCSVIDGRTLPSKYGPWAFTTDYPNFVDRRRGKSGDGIWLHGRDKPLAPKPDSNGCIALENQDLVRVSRFVRLQSTPLIVVDKMNMAPRSVILEQEQQVRGFIDSWKRSWESKNVEGYMSHYSTNFQSCWLDYNGWREKKRKLSRKYSTIRVKLGNVYLYRQNGLITAIFMQSYHSDAFHSSGIKVLYITNDASYKIYAEDYHTPADDPYPMAPLLARYGADPLQNADERHDFRIRLVSTDEPDNSGNGDDETPRLSAPSKPVTLERFARIAESAMPKFEENQKLVSSSSPDRLIVARSSIPQTKSELPENSDEGAQIRTHLVKRELERVQETKQSELVQSTGKEKRHASNTETKYLTEGLFDKAASEGTTKYSPHVVDDKVAVFLEKWKNSWEQKNLDRFMKMYHPEFEQGGMNFSALLKSKRNFFKKYRNIKVELYGVEIKKDTEKTVVSFTQSFRGDDYRDKGRKTLVLAESNDTGFRILSEEWSPLLEHSSDSGTQTKK